MSQVALKAALDNIALNMPVANAADADAVRDELATAIQNEIDAGPAGGFVPATRTISTTTPLTGGGDLSADRTIAIPAATTIADGYMTSTQVTELADRIPKSLAADANQGLYSTAINTWNVFTFLSAWRSFLGTTKATWDETNGVLKAFALQVDTAPTVAQTGSVGKVIWNDTFGTLEFRLKGGVVNLQVGQENVLRVRNQEVTPLADGEVAYVTGSSGTHVTVLRADASLEATSSTTIGVVTEPIGAHPGEGYITTFGMVTCDTNHLTEGAAVWLSTVAGQTTDVRPTAPDHAVAIGWCVKKAGAADGRIFVHVQNGFELHELHDVLLGAQAEGDTLAWDNVTKVWRNVTASAAAWLLKAGDAMLGPLQLAASALGAAGTAALKIPSGPLLLTPEAGAIERLVDKLYFTISSGMRKLLVLADASLTSGRIPFTTTDGRLTDTANLTRDAITGDITLGDGANLVISGGNASGESCIVFGGAPSTFWDSNVCRVSNTNMTMGFVCGTVPGFSGANGPFFGLRGNTFTAQPNQRGILFFYGGKPTTPGATEGKVSFGTNDIERMWIAYNGAIAISSSLSIGGGTAITKTVVYTPNLTPIAVSAGAAVEETFTVTGLSTSDTVTVNPPGAAVLSARVSAADTLALTFAPPASGSYTPPAGVYRIIAFRS